MHDSVLPDEAKLPNGVDTDMSLFLLRERSRQLEIEEDARRKRRVFQEMMGNVNKMFCSLFHIRLTLQLSAAAARTRVFVGLGANAWREYRAGGKRGGVRCFAFSRRLRKADAVFHTGNRRIDPEPTK